MAEEMMNEEMTGMAAPAPADAMEEPMPAAEPAPMEEEPSKYDMETMMGNFLDMDQSRRKLATRLLASQAVELFDEIIGEPAMASLREQLGNEIQVGGEEEPATPEGMMAPATELPTAEAPVAMSNGGVLGRKYGETSPENKKLIKLYKEDKLSLQGMQEFARDIDSRSLSEDESDTPSKEEMDVFYDMAYEYGEEELLPEKYSEK